MREKLTDRRVALAKPEAGRRLELWDADVEGLYLRAGAQSKAWWVAYRHPTSRKQMRAKVADYPLMSLSDARNRAQALLASVTLGGNPIAELDAKRRDHMVSPTVGQLCDAWMERFAKHNKKQTSIDLDTTLMTRHIKPGIGDVKAAMLTKREVLTFVDAMRGKGLTRHPSAALALLRAVFNWGIENDIVTANPTLGIRKDVQKPRDRTLSAAELVAYWAGLEHPERPFGDSAAMAMKLSLLTAQRISQVLSMTRGSLDLTPGNETWTAVGDDTKNGEVHIVPLSRQAVAIIKNMLASHEHEHVLPGRGGEVMDHRAVGRAYRRGRDTGVMTVDDVTRHDLRRTAATGMAKLGVRPDVISRVLDHSSVLSGNITSKIYVKFAFDPEQRDALQRWADHVETVVSGRSATVVPLRRVGA